jgi:hypothetical protein
LPRILAQEDELDRQLPGPDQTTETGAGESIRIQRRWVVLVAAFAAAPRLAYLFFFSDPENGGHGLTDAYHHWQIAYLTKEIGLSHGPRLWDMRGVEYFWGPMHPVLMNILFFATGSTDIVLARLLSLACGSAVVVLIFLLSHRYWGMRVAVGATAFAALSPASVFNDDMGMVEPIATALILFGIWLSPGKGFWSGVVWGLAALARVEAWLFSAGLVVAGVLGRRTATKALPLVAGWVLVMGLYAKFLLDQTGNPIYPLYWNFQIVAVGTSDLPSTFTPAQELLRIPMGIAVVAAAAGLGWALWKRPPSYLLLTYGFGYWVFQAGTLGFTAFLHDTTDWMYRRFELPLDFAAILVAVLLLRVIPQRWPRLETLGLVAAAAGLMVTQIFWLPVHSSYLATEPAYQDQVRIGKAVGAVYHRPEYWGRMINAPWNDPTVIYTMVRDGGVRGDQITSQFYDPFYYLPPGYHYRDHQNAAGLLLQCWLSDTHTRLLLLSPPNQFNVKVVEYEAFMADNPAWFIDTGVQLGEGWQVVGVNVPTPSHDDCVRGRATAAR